MRRSWFLCSLVLTIVPARVHAQDPSPRPRAAIERASGDESPRPRPRRRMREVGASEAVVSSVLSAGVLGAAFAPYHVYDQPQWRGGILFDDPIRDALHLRSAPDRELASGISDALVGGLVLAPVLLDAVLTAWLVHGDPELMGRMMLMNLQAHAIAQGITGVFKNVVGRERPNARACREDPERAAQDPLCQTEIEPLSFFSGHAAFAFTSAALICVAHTELGLLGQEGDAAACITGMALATTVGVLRVLADRHYASDVLVGAGVGLLSGWLVPALLDFDVADALGVDGASATIAPMVDGQTYGVQVMGVF